MLWYVELECFDHWYNVYMDKHVFYYSFHIYTTLIQTANSGIWALPSPRRYRLPKNSMLNKQAEINQRLQNERSRVQKVLKKNFYR